MGTERTRELHSPTAELVPPIHSSLPCTVMRTAIEGCWDRHRLSQPAVGNLSCSCRAGEGLPARPAAALLPAGGGATRCQDRRWPLTWAQLGCLHTHSLPACWSRPRAERLLWQAFGQPSVLPPCTHPLCASCAGESSERDLCFMSVSGQICATNIRAGLRCPILEFYSCQVFLLSPGCNTSSRKFLYSLQQSGSLGMSCSIQTYELKHYLSSISTSHLTNIISQMNQGDRDNLREPTDTEKVPQLPVISSTQTHSLLPSVCVITASWFLGNNQLIARYNTGKNT